MRIGDQLEIEITDLAFRGEGVGRADGLAVFVPLVIPGERVRVEVQHCKPRFCRASLVAVLEPAPDRLQPPCPYFGVCGGCNYQHMSYERQTAEKQRQIAALLARIGKIEALPQIQVVPCPRPFGYRNRVKVHHRPPRTGFYGGALHQIVDVPQCLLADAEVNEGLKEFRTKEHAPGEYEIRSAKVRGAGFEQVNPPMYDALRDTVRAALQGAEQKLFEGYCGSGFLTQTVSSDFETVVGVDRDRRAIGRATKLHLPNVKFFCKDTMTAFKRRNQPADALLVDPPRCGLPNKLIDAIGTSNVQRAVYVSCDPSTFARDAGRMSGAFALSAVTFLDMFPQTAHIELVGTFVRRGGARAGRSDDSDH